MNSYILVNIFKEESNQLHLQDSTSKTELGLNFSAVFPTLVQKTMPPILGCGLNEKQYQKTKGPQFFSVKVDLSQYC